MPPSYFCIHLLFSFSLSISPFFSSFSQLRFSPFPLFCIFAKCVCGEWIPLIPLLFCGPSGSRQNHPHGLTLGGQCALKGISKSPSHSITRGRPTRLFKHYGCIPWYLPASLFNLGLLLSAWVSGTGEGTKAWEDLQHGGGSSSFEVKRAGRRLAAGVARGQRPLPSILRAKYAYIAGNF